MKNIEMDEEKCVAFAFDGVIRKMDGTINKEVADLIRALSRKGYAIIVFTTEALTLEGRRNTVNFLTRNCLIEDIASISASKPLARCYVDSRALTFNGTCEGLQERIEAFHGRNGNVD